MRKSNIVLLAVSVIGALTLACTTTADSPDAIGDPIDASPSQIDASPSQIDASPSQIDAAVADATLVDAPTTTSIDAPAVPIDAAPSAYRHTITIDGTNDFATEDTFGTTSAPSYIAYVSWDNTNLYIGYSGPDIDVTAAQSANKWVLVYLDVDPSQGTGALSGETYATQTPTFPSNFGAEYYWRWKSDDTFSDLRSYAGAWSTVGNPAINHAVSGTYMEVSIPLSSIGNPSTLGIVTMMLNETGGSEWTYAGLYAGSFSDGFNAATPATFYLKADFSLARAPNHPLNQNVN